MKKVQTNKIKKLILAKTTVAKLQMSQQQMALLKGGADTKPTTKPTVNNNSIVDDPQNPCTIILPTFPQ